MKKNKLRSVSDAELIYSYYLVAKKKLVSATGNLTKRSPKNENILSKDGVFAYKYARYFLKNRFELGEEEIGNSIEYSYYYAVNVIKNKLPDKMHNKMLGHALEQPENEFIKKYFEWIKTVDNKDLQGTNKKDSNQKE